MLLLSPKFALSLYLTTILLVLDAKGALNYLALIKSSSHVVALTTDKSQVTMVTSDSLFYYVVLIDLQTLSHSVLIGNSTSKITAIT